MRINSIIILLLQSVVCLPQDTILLTYEQAVKIALNESYTIKSHMENKTAMQNYFMYHKAQFKPRLDFNLFAPSWNESVTQINRPDSLPVFNSTGSLKAGGDLSFTYILPTGGNLALHSMIYQEHLSTALATQGGYNTLTADQAYTKFGISFNQPIFTKNTLKENLKEAEYQYQRSSNYYTRGQMDIVYNVTEGFYSLYRATREVEINKEKLENSKEAYRIAKLKLGAKRIAEAEVLIAEVEVEQDKARLSESVSNKETEKDIFKQLIGLELEKNIDILTSIQYDTFYVDIHTAIEQALNNRLEIEDAELYKKLQEIDVDRAKRERELKGNISAYYDITGLGMMNEANTGELFDRSFNNLTERPPNRGIVFTLSYPIHDWGRGKAKVAQARAELRDAQLAKENIQTTIVRQVRNIVRTVKESQERLKIHEKNQELAIRSYKISQLRFENGDITSQELGQEQERLSEVQLAYLNAYITYQLAVADLKRKTMWDFGEGRSYLLEVKSEK
jgi:outer membrane protein